MMKLLVLSNNPDRASFRQRIGVYLDYLRQEGIETSVHKLPKSYLSRWKLFKKASNFDSVFLHKKTLNIFDSRILRKYAKKIIYDFDDAIMFSPHKPQNNNTSHFRLFKRTIKMMDMVMAGNDYLAEQAREFNANVEVLPTGLVLDDYKIIIEKPNDNKMRLVWIGSKSTLKYLEDLKPILEQIGKKCDNIILRIIADVFFDLENMPVEKFQWSKKSQARDLMACDVGLAPLPDNLFTRGKCGFKILQYFAANLPVIASPVGVNKTFIEKSNAGVLTDGKEKWIDAIVNLIDDEQKRVKMAQNGRNYVIDYDCEILKNELIELLKKLF